jgi:hypothetical protein
MSLPSSNMSKTDRPRIVTYLDSEEMKRDLERLALTRSRSVSNLLVALIKSEVEAAKASGEMES